MELWSDIRGFEGFYMISSMGAIKSVERRVSRSNGASLSVKGRMLKPAKNKSGYKFFSLWVNGKGTNINAHRCVAEHFVENKEGKPCVNHIDGIKDNNQASNLEWCTHSENMKHASDSGLCQMGETHYAAKLKDIDVHMIRDLKKDFSIKNQKIADLYGVESNTISRIVNMKRRKSLKPITLKLGE